MRRFVLTSAIPGTTPHGGFMENLRAYARHHDAELVVAALGPRSGRETGLSRAPIDFAGRLDLRADVLAPTHARLPLEGLQHLSSDRWAAFPHAALQMESLPRVGSRPPRVQLTTGAATPHVDGARRTRTRLGAMVVELLPDGRVFTRTVSSGADGDGAFHDLDAHVSAGRVSTGNRVARLVLGDLHHPLCDEAAVRATWGDGAPGGGLAGRLRPRTQVLHDVCDMRARSHHQRRDQHARFSQRVRGTGDVRSELAATTAFLERIRLADGRTVVVHSNHDDGLTRWLRDADHRTDPLNAEFYLDRERALHGRVRAGADASTFFAETLRGLSADGLAGVRFLVDGESLDVGGVECGVHGHAGPDGCRGRSARSNGSASTWCWATSTTRWCGAACTSPASASCGSATTADPRPGRSPTSSATTTAGASTSSSMATGSPPDGASSGSAAPPTKHLFSDSATGQEGRDSDAPFAPLQP